MQIQKQEEHVPIFLVLTLNFEHARYCQNHLPPKCFVQSTEHTYMDVFFANILHHVCLYAVGHTLSKKCLHTPHYAIWIGIKYRG
jgi:hypothetical protein